MNTHSKSRVEELHVFHIRITSFTGKITQERSCFNAFLNYIRTLTYRVSITTLEKKPAYIKKVGYIIAYGTMSKTHKHLNKFDLPGVYKLNSGCNKFYIGHTGPSFKERYTEHIIRISPNPQANPCKPPHWGRPYIHLSLIHI